MWATAPETEGVACDVSDPVVQALCKYPHLRGLKPFDLAKALRVSPARAQMAILKFAGMASGSRIVFEGISADDAMSQAGRAAPPTGLRFEDSPDAGAPASFVDQILERARPFAPVIVVLFVIALILAEAGTDGE